MREVVIYFITAAVLLAGLGLLVPRCPWRLKL